MYAIPKIRRRIFFYVSALAFFAIAPFLVLYSLGYAFDIKRKTVEETGGIFVKTNQTGFTVSLNGGAIQKSSLLTRGLLVSNLTPGQYRFRAEKEGYRPWEKIVSVTQFGVREIRNIILLPDPLTKEAANLWSAEEHLEHISVSPKAQYAAFELKHRNTGRRTLLLFKPSENKIAAQFPLSGPAQEILWNGAETAVLLITAEKQTREYAFIALSGALPRKTNLFENPATIFGTTTPRVTHNNIKKIRFGGEDNAFVVLTRADALLFFDVATARARILAEDIEEFEMLDTEAFFVAKNGFAARTSLADNATVTVGRKGYALSGAPIQALQTERGDLFFQDGAGGLFFSSRNGTGEFALMETGIRGIALDGEEKKLFFLKQNAIGIMHLEDNPYQPFEKRGDKTILFQSNDTTFLDGIWHTEDNAHIILNTSSGVFLLDSDNRGDPHIAELDAQPARKIFWDPKGGNLRLVGDTTVETITMK